METKSLTPKFDKRVKQLDGVYGKIKVEIKNTPVMHEKIAVIDDETSSWNNYCIARSTVYEGGTECFMPNNRFKLNGSRK